MMVDFKNTTIPTIEEKFRKKNGHLFIIYTAALKMTQSI